MRHFFIIALGFSVLTACSNRTTAPAPVVYHGVNSLPKASTTKPKEPIFPSASSSSPSITSRPLMPVTVKPLPAKKPSEPATLGSQTTIIQAPIKTPPPAERALKTAALEPKKAEKQKNADAFERAPPLKKEDAVKPSSASVSSAHSSSAKDKTNASSPSFSLPVKGEILSNFGRKQGDRDNQGINIAAPAGTPVQAAAEGEVAFAGERKGFGKLVLIRHKDGWITAYAHLSRILVQSGARLQKGQHIAEVGQSGDVEEPQIHFEMRRNKKAVNPLDYVRP